MKLIATRTTLRNSFSTFREWLKRWIRKRSVYKNYVSTVYKNALRRAFIPRIENKYVFVLGATHGGTTLLAEILSTSSSVSSNNHYHTREGQLLPTVADHMFTHGRQWDEDLKIDWNFVKKEWRKYWDVRKKILLEKSPPNLLRAKAIEETFKPAYFLVFVRDPYPHCESFIRKNGFTPREAAEFVVRTLKVQQRNLKELHRTVLVHYESLAQDHEAFKNRLTEFLEELHDIRTDGIFDAHNYYEKPQALKNFNQEKIDRLSPAIIEEINEVLCQNKQLLDYFGYSVRS